MASHALIQSLEFVECRVISSYCDAGPSLPDQVEPNTLALRIVHTCQEAIEMRTIRTFFLPFSKSSTWFVVSSGGR